MSLEHFLTMRHSEQFISTFKLATLYSQLISRATKLVYRDPLRYF